MKQSVGRKTRLLPNKGMIKAQTSSVNNDFTAELDIHLYRGVATSMIARHKKPRHDLIDVLHLKSCGTAEKSLRGCIRRAIIEVATPRLSTPEAGLEALYTVA